MYFQKGVESLSQTLIFVFGTSCRKPLIFQTYFILFGGKDSIPLEHYL